MQVIPAKSLSQFYFYRRDQGNNSIFDLIMIRMVVTATGLCLNLNKWLEKHFQVDFVMVRSCSKFIHL